MTTQVYDLRFRYETNVRTTKNTRLLYNPVVKTIIIELKNIQFSNGKRSVVGRGDVADNRVETIRSPF